MASKQILGDVEYYQSTFEDAIQQPNNPVMPGIEVVGDNDQLPLKYREVLEDSPNFYLITQNKFGVKGNQEIILPFAEIKQSEKIKKIQEVKNLEINEDLRNRTSFIQLLGRSCISSAINNQKRTPPTSNLNQIIGTNTTTPEQLPELAVPIVEFLEQLQPHIVIGCDRGGRLFSVAVKAAWRQLKDGEPFPTVDGKIHFTRVSKSEDPQVLQQQIDDIIAGSLKDGEKRGNPKGQNERLRVLFIDDWVVGGGTKRLAMRLMAKHNASTYFAVMCGSGADATGDPIRSATVSWRDDPAQIGVNYLSSMHVNTDSTITSVLRPEPVRTASARLNRQKIYRAAQALALQRSARFVA